MSNVCSNVGQFIEQFRKHSDCSAVHCNKPSSCLHPRALHCTDSCLRTSIGSHLGHQEHMFLVSQALSKFGSQPIPEKCVLAGLPCSLRIESSGSDPKADTSNGSQWSPFVSVLLLRAVHVDTQYI